LDTQGWPAFLVGIRRFHVLKQAQEVLFTVAWKTENSSNERIGASAALATISIVERDISSRNWVQPNKIESIALYKQ